MAGVIVAGLFNSFLVWGFLILTYFGGYHYFIDNRIMFTHHDMWEAGYMAIAFTAAVIFIFSTRINDVFGNLLFRNRKPSGEDARRLYPLLENLQKKICEKYGYAFKKIDIRVKDSAEINVIALGTRTIAFTTAILKEVDDEELEGVLSHELGHLYYKDTLYGGTIAVLFIFACLFMFMAAIIVFIAYIIGKQSRGIIGLFVFISLFFITFSAGVVFVGILGCFIIFGILLKACCRKKEFRADRFGSSLGYSEILLSHLEKYHFDDVKEKWHQKVYRALFSTHPKTILRTNQLRQCI